MDSSRSTHYTLQSPMNRAEKWAMELLQNGKQTELLDLLNAIPAIEGLRSIGFSINDICDIDAEKIYNLVDDEYESHQSTQAFEEARFEDFRSNLKAQTDDFYREANNLDLQMTAKATVQLMQETGIKFEKYLRNGMASKWHRQAYEMLIRQQKRVVNSFAFAVTDRIFRSDQKMSTKHTRWQRKRNQLTVLERRVADADKKIDELPQRNGKKEKSMKEQADKLRKMLSDMKLRYK